MEKYLDMEKYFLNNKLNIKVLIPEKKIKKRVKEIANKINSDFKDESLILIGVLNGSFLFFADLIRELNIDYKIDFVKISSYGDSLKSSGTINKISDINIDVSNKNVIIVEDIVDSGNSLKYLKNQFDDKNLKSLRFITLLHKPHKSSLDFFLDYVGFEIGDEFVVGYGLDYKQKLRGLNSIYTLIEEC